MGNVLSGMATDTINTGYSLSSSDYKALNAQNTFIQFISSASSTAAISTTYIPQFTGNMLIEAYAVAGAATTAIAASEFSLKITAQPSSINSSTTSSTFVASGVSTVSGGLFTIFVNKQYSPMTPLTLEFTRGKAMSVPMIKFQELTSGVIH